MEVQSNVFAYILLSTDAVKFSNVEHGELDSLRGRWCDTTHGSNQQPKKYRIMRTILKGLMVVVMGACGFVAIGEMNDCSFTEMVVMKLVASGLLLYCVKCYKAIGEHDTDGTQH